MIYTLGNVFLYIGAVAAIVFVISYQVFSEWHKVEAGRFIMSLMVCIALALGYSSWRTIAVDRFPLPESVQIVRAGIFGFIAILMCWMLSMFYRRQISGRKEERTRIERRKDVGSGRRHTG